MKSFAPRLLAALVSGAVLVLVSPPTGISWLHWFSFLPLFWALRPGEGRKNALLGYLSGWLGVFLLFFWLAETIVRFSSLPQPVAVGAVVLFATAFALPYALVFGSVHWLRDRFGPWWVLLVPTLQVTVEKLGPALFPYYHGVGQFREPWIWQLASVTGVMGLSWLVFLTNCALAEVVYRWREGLPQRWLVQGGALAIFLANLGFGAWRHGSLDAELAEAPTIRVAMLQQNVTMEERLSASPVTGFRAWLELTQAVTPDRPDLVVWPEGSVAFNPHSERKARVLGDRSPKEFFEDMTAGGDFDFLVGGGTIEKIEVDENGRRSYLAYNSAYVFTDDVGLADRYDKMVPLPFGEYVPFGDTFPFLKDLIQGPGDFKAGLRPTVFHGTADDGPAYDFTAPICYEAILESAMWELYEGEEGRPVDLFVNITNDAWFGDTASPHQHAMLTAVQAIQFGRPLVRLAYTGISWVIEADGDVVYETAPFTEVAEVVEVGLGGTRTVYTRGGWLFPWLCVVVSGGAFVVGRRRGA